MVEVGKAFWVNLAQPAQQGQSEEGAQTQDQVAAEGLQGGGPHNLWSACASALSLLPGVQREPSVSLFVPTASYPGTEHHQEEPGSIFAPPFQVN